MRTIQLALLAALVAPRASAQEDSAPDSAEVVAEVAPTGAATDAALLGEVPGLIRGATDWILENQNEDGSYGSHKTIRTYELTASVPGTHRAYRVACTALCLIALEDGPIQTDATRAAASRAVDYLLTKFDVKRPNGMEFFNTWSFAYTLHALGEWLVDHPDDERAAAARVACEKIVERAAIYQGLDGGYGYLDFNLKTRRHSMTGMSFTTATMLMGFDRVRAAGIDVPQPMVDKALRHVTRQRGPTGSYAYHFSSRLKPAQGINVRKGAACRNPQCEYTLGLFGVETSQERRLESLDDLLVRHTGLQRIASRRPIPHESWYQISGYFYLYGHAYAAYSLEQMPVDVQDRLWPAMVDALKVCHQPDGSFWDYPVYGYHKPYGTAFALMALARVPPPKAASEGPR